MMARDARVRVYTAGLRSFCTAAKVLPENKGVGWEEIRFDTDPEGRRETEALTGRPRAPRALINARPVGGYQGLGILDMTGELGGLLAGACPSP